MPDEDGTRLTAAQIAVKGTVIALITIAPSLLAFFVAWTLLDDLFYAVVIGGIVHFVAMGFSLKIAKKLLIRAE